MAAEIIQVNTQDFIFSNYEENDISLLPSFEINTSLNSNSYIESFIYDNNKTLLNTNYFFSSYLVLNDGKSSLNNGELSQIEIDPENYLTSLGFDQGEYITYFNILNKQIGDEFKQLYITEISSDRTEIRLDSISLTESDIVEQTNIFIQERENSTYFLDFYLNFGDNNLLISNNISLDNQDPTNPTVLIKLYEPLPDEFDINSTLWVVTIIEEPIAYKVIFEDIPFTFSDTENISGPNFDLKIKDQTNNSTLLLSYEDLIFTSLTSSANQLNSFLEEKELDINIDYTNFNNFIHFSSAQKRIENFIYKINLIEQYSSSIAILDSQIIGPTSITPSVSNSKAVYESKINSIITNFDGYDYYLYYSSESLAYPKSTISKPYTLYSTTSPETITWLGSNNEFSAYYGGILLSASIYDNLNQNNLLYTIPEYLREDPANDPYQLFIEMVGQHYDNIWVYYRDVTQKYNADNRLENGISKDIVADAIKDFGIKLYQNNFSNEDLYTAFLGLTPEGGLFPFPNITGSLPTPSGYEYIDTKISASNDYLPLDDVNKSLYKRIYHNLPYLLQTKGTLPGLRALITSYGIPDTILRIKEYGGKDKINTNDWDYWQNEFNYAYKQNGDSFISSSFVLNPSWGSNSNTPETVMFRFKTNGLPTSLIPYSQSLLTITSTSSLNVSLTYISASLASVGSQSLNINGITLYYTGSATLPVNTPNIIYIRTGSFAASTVADYVTTSSVIFNFSRSIAPYSASLQYISSSILSPYLVLNSTSSNDSPGDPSYVISGSTTTYFPYRSYLTLRYAETAYTSGSYSGSIISPSYQYAYLEFYPNYSAQPTLSSSVYLPFFNGDWWSVMIKRIGTGSSTNFELYSGNKMYDGGENGTTIGFISSSIVTSEDNGWTNTTSISFGSKSNPINSEIYNSFSGSFQEIRYYNKPISESVFKDFVMNPSSIEGNSINSGANELTFRLPLGGELYTGLNSIHPKVTGSWVTTSSFTSNSTAFFNSSPTFISNTEYFYYDQPIVGIRNTIADKIRVENNVIPDGDVLSSFMSLSQQANISQSYTANTNLLEVAFSPQDEINDDINSSLGYFNIGEYIGDPRLRSSSAESYPSLNSLRDSYFQKYTKNYNLVDFIRLIKFFDNSLFKMIKDFVPARTSLASGIIIKQHILERNKYPQPQVNTNSTIAYYPQSTILDYNISASNTSLTGDFYFSNIGSQLTYPITSFQSITGNILGYFNTSSGVYTFPSNPNVLLNITASLITSGSMGTSLFIISSSANGIISSQNINSGTTLTTLSSSYSPTSGDQLFLGIKVGIGYTNHSFNLMSSSLFITQSTPPQTGSINSPIFFQNILIPGTVSPQWNNYNPGTIENFSGGTAGSFEIFNSLTTSPLGTLGTGPNNMFNITQSWSELTQNASGSVNIIHNSQDEFYNGEFKGSVLTVTTQSLSLIEPFISTSSFNNSELNPLINNATEQRYSTFALDVDYSNGINPVNFNLLISGTATPATIPDSNFTQKKSILPRYEGSKSTSYELNKWSPSDTGTYGKSPTISSLKTMVAYCDWISGWPPEHENASAINVLYLIKSDGSVVVPNSSKYDLSEMQQTFVTGERVSISSKNQLFSSTDSFRTIIKSGAHIEPILYNQIGQSPNQTFTSSIFLTSNSDAVWSASIANPIGMYGLKTQTTTINSNLLTAGLKEIKFLQENFKGTDTTTSLISPDNQIRYKINQSLIDDKIDLTFEYLLSIVNLDPLQHLNRLNYSRRTITRFVLVRLRGGIEETIGLFPQKSKGFFTLLPITPITKLKSIKFILPFTSLKANDEIYLKVLTSQTLGILPSSTLSVTQNIPPGYPTNPGISTLNLWISASNATVQGVNLAMINNSGFEGTNILYTTNDSLINSFNDPTALMVNIPDSSVNPIRLPWSLINGDEFKFEGKENEVYQVNKAMAISSSGAPSGSVLAIEFNGPLPISGSIDFNNFLIRRFVTDPSQTVISGFKPPNSTGPYIVKPEFVVPELDISIDKIITNLTLQGILPTPDG